VREELALMEKETAILKEGIDEGKVASILSSLPPEVNNLKEASVGSFLFFHFLHLE